MCAEYIGLEDALGNRLNKFDVVTYGARSGTGSTNNQLLVLHTTPGGFIRGVRRVHRFQRYDPVTDEAIRDWELEETTIRLPESVVKVHPDYFNENLRTLVTQAKEQYSG